VIPPETCDDGNLIKCNSNCIGARTGYTCTLGSSLSPSVCTPNCGDGLILNPEICDDNDLTNNDGCSSTCTVESSWECTSVANV